MSIAPQGLSAALQEFSQATKLYVIYAQGDVINRRTAGASGDLTAEEALMQLVSGTQLTYRFINDDTVTILPAAEVTYTDEAHPPEAQQAEPARSQEEIVPEEVVVTGTRATGVSAADSASPIQVLSNDALARVGTPDLVQSLSQNIPSLMAQQYGNDAAAFNKSFKLRGVSPNQTLVLVNGTRRHGTANINVYGGAFVGNAAADLNFIPVAAIDHVEVLQDGAAAQYGSDAMAGVVNIILKNADTGGTVTAGGGHYYDQGGDMGTFSSNFGFRPSENSFLNLTLEAKYQGHSNRSDVDPRVLDLDGSTEVPPYGNPVSAGNIRANVLGQFPQIAGLSHYPYLSPIQGDSQTRLYTLFYNGGYDVSDAVQLYSFGSFGDKDGQAYQAYRAPNVVTDAAGTPAFPLGFTPKQNIRETDYSMTAGGRGTLGDTTWNLSTTYGANDGEYWLLNSANASLYRDTGATPTDIRAGGFFNWQWTTNVDLTHELDVGLAGPMTLAFGAEYRQNGYEVKAGELASYYSSGSAGGGSQGYFGFSPANASEHSRNNYAVYGDVAVRLLEQLSMEAALRHEEYSDFGNATVWKVNARYDFNDVFAIRATANTGFRAPAMAEQYYSGINVGPSSVSGMFAPNSPGAHFLGFDSLKPETSDAVSVGLVIHPIPRMTITVDGYRLTIDDRIVKSGTIFGYNTTPRNDISPSVLLALQASNIAIDPNLFNASSAYVGIQTFVNGATTDTKGLDLAASYLTDYGRYGTVDYSLAVNYNTTEVESVRPPPTNVNPNVVLLDRIAISTIEHTSPETRGVFGAYWNLGRWSVNLRESYYGSVWIWAQNALTGQFVKNDAEPAWLTDLEVGVTLGEKLKVTVGANNLFNRYPNHTTYGLRESQLITNSSSFAFSNYPAIVPYGFNGGFYYARAAWNF